MGLLALAVLGLAFWALNTGRLGQQNSRKTVAVAIAGVGLILLGRGRVLPSVALLAGGAALWPWRAAGRHIAMSADEARSMLGVETDADEDAIRAAHRRLIARLHPDQGGTDALASQINRARDIALSALCNK